MSHDPTERLVEMATDIGNFFQSEADDTAAATAIAGHIRSFWVPRMRERIMAYVQDGGALPERVTAAVRMLATMP
jgi:formate dehydrogenase subunit delta